MFTAALASALSALDTELKIVLLLMESLTAEQRAALWTRHEQRLERAQARVDWLQDRLREVTSGSSGSSGANGRTGQPPTPGSSAAILPTGSAQAVGERPEPAA